MYDQLVEDSDWLAKRVCRKCKNEVEIYSDDLLYQRNPDGFWKKECYGLCKTDGCNSKIHISKTFIPKNILNRVPKNTRKRMTKRETHEHYLNKVKNISLTRKCKNCKHTNTVSYDKLYVKRGSFNPFHLLGFKYMYTMCDRCGVHDELYISFDDEYDGKGYQAFIDEHIKEYDGTNICRNIKTALISAPFALLFYGVGIPLVIVTLPITLPVILLKMWLEYGETKDTVRRW